MKNDSVGRFASQMNANVIIRENHSNEVCHLEITKLSAIKKLFFFDPGAFQNSEESNFPWSSRSV